MLTVTALEQDDSNSKAYCTKCQKQVPSSQVKHELGYALVDGIGHTLVCVCVGCANKRFIETQPANYMLQESFRNWMMCAFALSKGCSTDLTEIADREFKRAAAIFDVTTSEIGVGVTNQ